MYAFKFGFGVGFIDKGHLESDAGSKVEDGTGDLNKPLSNQNLVTLRKDTPVYNAPDISSTPRLAYWWIIALPHY